jgi:hypothetical protein
VVMRNSCPNMFAMQEACAKTGGRSIGRPSGQVERM